MPCSSLVTAVGAMLALCAPSQVELRERVNDHAHVIKESTKTRLSALLAELEQQTGAQIVIVTLDSTQGRDLYEVASETFKSAGRTGKGLGQAGRNNGVLVMIAVQDRKWRILPGEGLEGELPDLYCDSVAQEYFVPYFRRGNYSQGILMGTTALATRVAKKYGVQLAGAPALPSSKSRRRGSAQKGSACFSVLFAMIVLLMVFSAIASRGGRRNRRRWGGGGVWDAIMIGSMLSNMARGSRGGWSGRSSWGGGGGGGFGGGGGGSFGGGGAGGSW